MTEKIINRIRALLAKAESTTPEEAELLNAKAEELLIRHEISMAQIAADHTRPEGYVALTFNFAGVYAVANRRLVCATGDALNGFPVFWGSKKGQSVRVYVWESSAEHVSLVDQDLMNETILEWISAVDDSEEIQSDIPHAISQLLGELLRTHEAQLKRYLSAEFEAEASFWQDRLRHAPGNTEYQMHLRRMQNPGQTYRTQTTYAQPGGLLRWCWSMILLNLLCNCCCGGWGFRFRM